MLQYVRICYNMLEFVTICYNMLQYVIICYSYIYIYMSNLENPRTSINLGRSHRLPHVCTIMIYGRLGGYRLQETATFIYIIHKHQRPS